MVNNIESTAKLLIQIIGNEGEEGRNTKKLSARLNLSPLEIFSAIQLQNKDGDYFQFDGLAPWDYPIFRLGQDGLNYLAENKKHIVKHSPKPKKNHK